MLKNKIVLLPFPFDDFSVLKVRPVVCLIDLIGKHQQLVVAFITSQIPEDILPTDLVIGTDHPEFSITGLKVSSTVRLHRLMTVNIDLIRRELGEIPPALQTELKHGLANLFSM